MAHLAIAQVAEMIGVERQTRQVSRTGRRAKHPNLAHRLVTFELHDVAKLPDVRIRRDRHLDGADNRDLTAVDRLELAGRGLPLRQMSDIARAEPEVGP